MKIGQQIPLYTVTGIHRGGGQKRVAEPAVQPSEGRRAAGLDAEGVRECECLS